MNLTELEQHILAYYIAGAAGDLTMIDRYYPTGEMILIIEDKIQVATRSFGFKVTSKAKPAATAFLEHMIAAGAFSSTQGKLGGVMHQFQAAAYRKAIEEQRANNPILQKAKAGGPEFWKQAFAALV